MSACKVLVPLSLLVLVGGGHLSAQDTPLRVGDAAPRVVVHDLDGKPVDLARYVGSKPVFLEFWATWCESCRELLPHVLAARKRFGGKVEFIGINVAVNQSPGGVRQYLKEHDPDFPTLYDDEGTSTRAYQVPATSYVVILDRSGKVAYTGVGGTQSFDRVLSAVSQ
jgi:thiol-disulfide isomerase/thioredoxin